ncbi:hypothetical protein Salat_2098900 [Sesamum alatum]|uniref:Uncharacterized protein n=1 Tax=Sesamum alatum TaxID=300844 RepID=A0AAE1Y1S3_9LAMI|nr:hypothetical protein Salat_2098900 [Sesamum alatum]
MSISRGFRFAIDETASKQTFQANNWTLGGTLALQRNPHVDGPCSAALVFEQLAVLSPCNANLYALFTVKRPNGSKCQTTLSLLPRRNFLCRIHSASSWSNSARISASFHSLPPANIMLCTVASS